MPRSRRMRDMARRSRDMRDRRRDMRDGRVIYRDRADMRGDRADMRGDMRRDRADYGYADVEYLPDSQSDRHYFPPKYPPMYDYDYDSARSRRTGRYIRDRRDYAGDKNYLEDEEVMEFQKTLLEEIEPQYKTQFEKNKVIQRGREMGVDFKDYTEDEYLATVLMIATDYGKTVGMNNTDQMLRMAVNWLEDDDAALQGSEKLAVYYDEIICAED